MVENYAALIHHPVLKVGFLIPHIPHITSQLITWNFVTELNRVTNPVATDGNQCKHIRSEHRRKGDFNGKRGRNC